MKTPSPFLAPIALALALCMSAPLAAQGDYAGFWRRPSPDELDANLAAIGEELPEELLRNGGFEEGEGDRLRGWSTGFWGNGGNHPEVAARTIVRSEEAARSGRFSCKIDASLGAMTGRVFIIGQHLFGPHRPVEAFRGKTLRYSLWSMLQTAPRPDGDPVFLNVRQWRGRQVIRHHRAPVYNDTGEWSCGEVVFEVSMDAERLDVQAQVPNTLPTGQPSVMYLDDLSVKVAADPLLEVDVLSPEIPRKGAGLPMDCRLGGQLAGRGALQLAFAVSKGGETLRVFRRPAAPPVLRECLPVADLPAGEYALETALAVEGVGPVALVKREFIIYEGPFDAE